MPRVGKAHHAVAPACRAAHVDLALPTDLKTDPDAWLGKVNDDSKFTADGSIFDADRKPIE